MHADQREVVDGSKPRRAHLEQISSQGCISQLQVLWNMSGGDHSNALLAERAHIDGRAMRERPQCPDVVHARERATHDPQAFEVVEFRRASAAARKNREAE